jgi:hypothetical protein
MIRHFFGSQEMLTTDEATGVQQIATQKTRKLSFMLVKKRASLRALTRFANMINE